MSTDNQRTFRLHRLVNFLVKQQTYYQIHITEWENQSKDETKGITTVSIRVLINEL